MCVPSGQDAQKSFSQMLSVEHEVVAYSSADEGRVTKATKLPRGRSSEDDKAVIRQRRMAGTRPSKLALQRRSDPTLSHSVESLAASDLSSMGTPSPIASPKVDKRLFPSMPKSPIGKIVAKLEMRKCCPMPSQPELPYDGGMIVAI